MAWTISLTPHARKALVGLDRSATARIVSTFERKLAAHGDPRAFGKALAGELAALWRYRVGDYRLISRIEDSVVTIFVPLLDGKRVVAE